jgi:hypothetical protein
MLVGLDSNIELTPLQTACLSLQMHDIPEVALAICQFGSTLRTKNIVVTNNASLSRIMGALVRHSNGLAFVDGAALTPLGPGSDPPICVKVTKLVEDLKNELHTTTERLTDVLVGMTSRASRSGDFLILARSLMTAKIETRDWHGILSVGGAIQAIVEGLLPLAIKELDDAKIDSKDHLKILTVGGAIRPIAEGLQPWAIKALEDAKIDSKHHVNILTVDGAIRAIADGDLPAVMSAFRDAGFNEPGCVIKILCVDGGINSVSKGKFVKAVAALRQAVIPDSLWATALGRSGVINHLALGNLTVVTTKMERWGLHQSGKGEIYSKSTFWDSIPFIVSDKFEIGEQQLKDATGQDVAPTVDEQLKDATGQDTAPTVDHTRRLQALCCQQWRSAIRQSQFEQARQIIENIDKKIAQKKQPLPTPKSKVQTSRKPASFETQVVAILKENCQDVSAWSSSKTVLDTFETYPMWKDWVSAGLDRGKLGSYINRLKQTHGKKDT